VRQVVEALEARRHPPDTTSARGALPPELLAVFEAMPVEDQRHGLDVLARLRGAGHRETPLLQAALLHDCGKANAGVGLHHRAARVVLRRAFPPAWAWLAGSPTGWRRPYWVVANHPERGAVWLATRGADDDLVALVRFHEAPLPEDWRGTERARWHAALAEVDART
jgi:hypothetical protein